MLFPLKNRLTYFRATAQCYEIAQRYIIFDSVV